MKIFMSNHKTWKDKTEDNVVLHTYNIKETGLIKVERGNWIDGLMDSIDKFHILFIS